MLLTSLSINNICSFSSRSTGRRHPGSDKYSRTKDVSDAFIYSEPKNYTPNKTDFFANKRLLRGQIADECMQDGIFVHYTTFFARYDLNWIALGKLLKSKFFSTNDFDIHCFAASTGEEPYTLAVLLKALYNDASIKIKASDISKKIISKDNKLKRHGGPEISLNNVLTIAESLGLEEQIFKYVARIKNKNGNSTQADDAEDETYRFDKSILNSVEFKTKNILDSLKDFSSSKPSLVMCRNMWPYVKPEEYYQFASRLYEKLAPGSLVVIGSIDEDGMLHRKNSNKFPKALSDSGFKKCAPYVYEKQI